MNRLTAKRRTTLSCVLLYFFSVLLLSWRVWPMPYAEEAFGAGGAIRTTICLEAGFSMLFLLMIYFKLPFLDYLGAYIEKKGLHTPQKAAVVAAALILLCAGVQAIIDLLPDGWGFGRYTYTSLLFLWLIYLLAAGGAAHSDLGKALPYRIAVVPILIALSRLVLHGFAPAFYLTVTMSIADILSLRHSMGKNRPEFRSILCVFLPPLLCFGLILAAKAILFPEVLDFQIRSMHGAANSYSLGAYIDLLREFHSLGIIYGICYSLLLVLGTVCAAWLLRRTVNAHRMAFLGGCAFFFAFCSFLQVMLNAELMARLMPYQWLVSGGLVCLLANSIVHNEAYSTNNNNKEVP